MKNEVRNRTIIQTFMVVWVVEPSTNFTVLFLQFGVLLLVQSLRGFGRTRCLLVIKVMY